MPEPIQNPDITIGPAAEPLTHGGRMGIENSPTSDVIVPRGSVIDSDTGRVVKPEDYLIQIPGVPKPLHLPANASKKEVEDLSQELHELWNAKGR